MFDLGDEFIIGSHRIPWLLWIHLLVMLLLIILLYHFTVFAFGLDRSTTAASTIASSSNSGSSTHRPPSNAPATVLLHNTKMGDSHSINGNTAARRRVGREEERDGISSSAKNAAYSSVLERPHHPCHFFGLAKRAFLKCLGLDPTSKDPSNMRQRREE